jgi:hypothetical protein
MSSKRVCVEFAFFVCLSRVCVDGKYDYCNDFYEAVFFSRINIYLHLYLGVCLLHWSLIYKVMVCLFHAFPSRVKIYICDFVVFAFCGRENLYI